MPALLAFAVMLVSTVAHAKLSGRDATPLSSSDIERYTPYAELARAAYCLGDSDTWDYGGGPSDSFGGRQEVAKSHVADACAANDDFELYGSGGDGTANSPYCTSWYLTILAEYPDSSSDFVGYSPSLTSIVVAHGGIEAEELHVSICLDRMSWPEHSTPSGSKAYRIRIPLPKRP